MTQSRNGSMTQFNQSGAQIAGRSWLSNRKLVHISMLGFAFLLPFLTWVQAAGAALLALMFNLFILPSLAFDLRKRPLSVGAPLSGAFEDAAPPPVGPSAQRVLGPARWSGRLGGLEGRPLHTWTGIILYPISVLALILVYRHSLAVVGAAWAIMALGDGMASVVGEARGGPALPHNSEKTWSGFGAFVLAGTTGAYVLTRWSNPAASPRSALVASAAAAVVGALVESLPIRLDDILSVPLVCGGFLFCVSLMEWAAFWSNWPFLKLRILLAAIVNLTLALLALRLRLVNNSGAAGGFVLGVAIYLGYGYKSFLLLLAFFTLGSVATRLGYANKAKRGVAERRGGARSWREAVANTVAAAFFALFVVTTQHQAAFLLAMIASLAEAAGDTVSSEIGQWLSPRAYLITDLRPVPAGENGGVSLGGTLAGLAASAIVVGLGYGMGLCSPGGAALALGAAIGGHLLDSLLGATLERRGLVTNGIVNFAGTSFAGAVALGFSL
jgi:uncharacterized protein (TIGR00297 family)